MKTDITLKITPEMLESAVKNENKKGIAELKKQYLSLCDLLGVSPYLYKTYKEDM